MGNDLRKHKIPAELYVFMAELAELPADLSNLSGGRHAEVLVTGRRKTWDQAYQGEIFKVPPSDIYKFGMGLGALSEASSNFLGAEEILDRLCSESFIFTLTPLEAMSVVIKAGEYKRRRGALEAAEKAYVIALRMLHESEKNPGRDDLASLHKEKGRLLYELAYLHRLRGDAGVCSAALEESETECVLANDPVGAEIARCQRASISCEEGAPEVGLRLIEMSLACFERLAEDAKIKAIGRSGLARRWVGNARSNLVRACIALNDTARARTLLEENLKSQRLGANIRGLSFERHREARLLLAEGNAHAARDALQDSYRTIDPAEVESTELVAAILAAKGLAEALVGEVELAKRNFESACDLPPDLNNRRAQAWAWGGRALIARDAGDRAGCLFAIRRGLALVQRCGAPIRTFLLHLRTDTCSMQDQVKLDDLCKVVCRFGD